MPEEIRIKTATLKNLHDYFYQRENEEIEKIDFSTSFGQRPAQSAGMFFRFTSRTLALTGHANTESKLISPPRNLSDCMCVILDQLNDLELHKGINQLCDSEDKEKYFNIAFELTKNTFKKVYMNTSAEQVDVDAWLREQSIDSIYRLLTYTAVNSADQNNQNISNFLLKNSVKEELLRNFLQYLGSATKLIAINKLISYLPEGATVSQKSLFICTLSIALDEKSLNEQDALNNILNNLEKAAASAKINKNLMNKFKNIPSNTQEMKKYCAMCVQLLSDDFKFNHTTQSKKK